jgi:hypothetical protein
MRDDGLEDPNGCTDPFTGETVSRGSIISVPVGAPMPPGSVPPPFAGGGTAPTTSVFVCRDGRWEGVVSYRDDVIELLSDEVTVVAIEDQTVVMTGRYSYGGRAEVRLLASTGVVEVDQDGGWTWQLDPEDRPAAGEMVVITATADDKMSKVAFELVHPEPRHG